MGWRCCSRRFEVVGVEIAGVFRDGADGPCSAWECVRGRAMRFDERSLGSRGYRRGCCGKSYRDADACREQTLDGASRSVPEGGNGVAWRFWEFPSRNATLAWSGKQGIAMDLRRAVGEVRPEARSTKRQPPNFPHARELEAARWSKVLSHGVVGSARWHVQRLIRNCAPATSHSPALEAGLIARWRSENPATRDYALGRAERQKILWLYRASPAH